ncbi:MAG: LTA synthase family protein [Patescibacteria group bacterium]|nr:LTA synthase family protein [Patescibacteria group bacterium]MCL5432257.1 LTA synthase family protein [Patescibacteria group bacterium]
MTKLFLTPILLTVAYIGMVFLTNINLLSLSEIIPPLLTFGLGAVIVCALFLLFSKNKTKAAVACSLCAVAFFSYGLVHEWSGAALLVVLVLIWRTKRDLAPVARVLFAAAVIITLISFLRIAVFQIQRTTKTNNPSPLVLPAVATPAKLPDIYYIVPEDYSSAAVMAKYFSTDISDFLGFLTDNGFFVASQSASNYPKSFLSIASTLNMEYLDYLSKYKNSSDQTIATPLIEDNNVMRFLRGQGYKYYQMGSWWDPTKVNPFADDNFVLEDANNAGVDELTYTALEGTMVRPILNRIFPQALITDSNKDKRRRILYQFDKLPDVIDLPGPKFVFLHVIAPHGPYVFDQDCKFIGAAIVNAQPETKSYGDQAHCINLKLENAINQIISGSATPPVILLQTDEGAPFLGGMVSPADNWKTASPDLLKEKFPIIAAYYLPGIKATGLYPAITPVNSFRLILNDYFHTNFPLLPDENFIFADANHLYEFTDVTAIAH